MTADPILKERLSHAVADVPLDVEQRLAEIRGGRRSPSQEPRSRRPLTFLVAAALVALIGLVLWQVRPATDRGVADTSVQPTGTIAYASEVGAGTDTFDVHAYALETASSDDVLVVAGEVPDESPFVRWSPDGTRLAYVRTGEHPAIVIANADGSSPQDVDVGVPLEHGLFAWSPDGTRIAFTAVNPDPESAATPLAILDLTTGDVQTLWQTDGSWRSFDWSPDGTTFALTGGPLDANNAISGEDLGLYVVNADGSDFHPILRGSTVRYVRWSPDGTRLAFGLRKGDDGDYRYDVATAAPDGSDLSVLTSWAGWDNVPVWSPDGRWIAFSSDRDASPEQLEINASRADGDVGGFGVYVMRADGTDVRQLVPSGDDDVRAPVDWRA